MDISKQRIGISLHTCYTCYKFYFYIYYLWCLKELIHVFFNFWKKKQKIDWKVSKILNLYVLSVFQFAAMRWASRIFPFSPYYIIPETSVIDGDSFFLSLLFFLYILSVSSLIYLSLSFMLVTILYTQQYSTYFAYVTCTVSSLALYFLLKSFLGCFPGLFYTLLLHH